jgi:hypothetical protein
MARKRRRGPNRRDSYKTEGQYTRSRDENYKSLEDLPRGMQIDTTTTAYGKAVPQGTPVPQFSNGGECRGAGAAVKGKKFQGVF